MESYRVVALAADGGRVFVATSGGEVIALGASDGKEAWRRRLATRVVLAGGLLVAAGRVWVVSESPAALFGLDPASGEPKGQIELGLPELGVRLPRVTDLPAFVPGRARLYLVVDDRTVYGVDLGAGRLLWRTAVGFGISRLIAGADGRRCFVIPEQYVHNAQILSLDPEKGAVVRRRSLLAGSLTDALAGKEALFVAQRNNDGDLVVEALDAESLKSRWRSVPLRLFRPSPLALGDGYLAVVGRARQFQQRPLGSAYATVGFARGVLLVCTDRGLFAYGNQDRRAAEREVAALWHRGDLAALARALCRLDQHERAVALLDRALRDEKLSEADYARLKDALNSAREALAARRPATLTARLTSRGGGRTRPTWTGRHTWRKSRGRRGERPAGAPLPTYRPSSTPAGTPAISISPLTSTTTSTTTAATAIASAATTNFSLWPSPARTNAATTRTRSRAANTECA